MRTINIILKESEIFYGRTEEEALAYGNNYVKHNPQLEFWVEQSGTKNRPFVVVAQFKEELR